MEPRGRDDELSSEDADVAAHAQDDEVLGEVEAAEAGWEPLPWWRSTSQLIAVTAAVVVGLQLLRVLFPLIGWYLRDTRGEPLSTLITYALIPFGLALLAPLWPRLGGTRIALTVIAGGLGLVRVLEQLTSSPGTDLVLALIGVTLFLWLLPAAFATAQGMFAHGFLLGLAVDTTIRGIAWTLDLSWLEGSRPLLATVGLAVVLLVGALLAVPHDTAWGPRIGPSLPLLGLGPLLFFELLALQNQGWVATETGWSWGAALLLIGIGNVLALTGASLARALPGQNATGIIGGVLVMILTVRVGIGGVLYAGLLLGAHLGAGMVVGSLTAPVEIRRMTKGTLAHGLSLFGAGLLFIVLAMVYYVGYDVDLPLSQTAILIGTGGLVTVFGFGASMSPRPVGDAHLLVVIIPLLLLLVPIGLLRDDPLAAVEPAAGGTPIRVATYNIHSGYTTEGVQDPEAIAATLEELDADVIGLQEVSRGWLLNGSTDLLGWLQRRLAMPYARFHATTEDPVWGNAILSRFPIVRSDRTLLPEEGTLIRRGAIAADIQLDNGSIRIINTHLHHEAENLPAVHVAQMERLLEWWDGAPATVVLGDMNAGFFTPELRMLRNAGFIDVWRSGTGPGYTAPAADPNQRIDVIYHSTGLIHGNPEVITSLASDHLPVVAVIDVAPQPEAPADDGSDGEEG